MLSIEIKHRLTPEIIVEPALYEVVVFGSNIEGKHGKGLARQALQWGAQPGKGRGYAGQTYGIPTRRWIPPNRVETLPLDMIKQFVGLFIRDAEMNGDRRHLVTRIGCGLAGYTPKDIAPMFVGAIPLVNVTLPEDFWNIILLIK